jgi:hypothetical protein
MALPAKALAGLMRGITQAMRDREESNFREREMAGRTAGQEEERELARKKYELNKRYIEAMMSKMNRGTEMVPPEQLQPLAEAYGAELPNQPMRQDLISPMVKGWSAAPPKKLKREDKKNQQKLVWGQANSVSKQIDHLTEKLNTERTELDDESIADMEKRRDELYATLDKIKEYSDSMGLSLPLDIIRPEKEAFEEDKTKLNITNEQAPTMGIGDLGNYLGGGLNKIRELFQR